VLVPDLVDGVRLVLGFLLGILGALIELGVEVALDRQVGIVLLELLVLGALRSLGILRLGARGLRRGLLGGRLLRGGLFRRGLLGCRLLRGGLLGCRLLHGLLRRSICRSGLILVGRRRRI